MGFPSGINGKEPACQCRRCKRCGSIPDQKNPLEECMATQPSILVWRMPVDRGDWQVTVHRVAKSQTRLKQLSRHTDEKRKQQPTYNSRSL